MTHVTLFLSLEIILGRAKRQAGLNILPRHNATARALQRSAGRDSIAPPVGMGEGQTTNG